ncbi:MAG: oligoendopeptidase F family protein [Bacilli bacterium]|nr:oligoendopeptidase F family protein [Bacilli bacterium]
MQKYKSRKDVPLKYKWDLTHYFKDEKDFNDNLSKCETMIDALKDYVGSTKDAKKLYEFLKNDIEANALIMNLYIYVSLLNDQELGNSKNIELLNKVEDTFNKYVINTSFFAPELLKLSKEEYEELFNKNNKLNEFKSDLDKIYRGKEHVIDEEKENIISELDNAMNHFDDMSSTMLNGEHDYGTVVVDGEEEKIATTNIRRLLKNEDRSFRKEVRDKYNKVLDRYGVSAAQMLNGYVKSNIVKAKLHNYKDAWDAKIFKLNMPNEAYETLLNTTEKHLDVLHRYYRVFKKSVGLKELYQYDLSLDMTKNSKKYSIEEAQELVLEAIKPLGEDYENRFKKVFDEHHIDYAQYPSKCSGGYCATSLDKHSNILMSFNYDLDSVSTIAHEGGHDIHHTYVNDNNPLQYREVSNLVAEVASLTNECLLSSYLSINGKTDEEKMSGIDNILGVIANNYYDAVREAKMEQDFYNYVSSGHTITKDYMDDLTYKSLEKYYGKEVILDEHSKNSWIVRSHYYMNYYLYSYAFCISIASYIASEILNGNKDMLEKYHKFLCTGSNVWPIDAIKILGIDLRKPDVYEGAINYFASLLDKFETMI